MPTLTELHAPVSGQTVDLALAATSHQLQLSAELVRAVTLHSPPDQTQANTKHRNFKVAWIDGTVVQHQGQVGLALVLVVCRSWPCQALAVLALQFPVHHQLCLPGAAGATHRDRACRAGWLSLQQQRWCIPW